MFHLVEQSQVQLIWSNVSGIYLLSLCNLICGLADFSCRRKVGAPNKKKQSWRFLKKKKSAFVYMITLSLSLDSLTPYITFSVPACVVRGRHSKTHQFHLHCKFIQCQVFHLSLMWQNHSSTFQQVHCWQSSSPLAFKWWMPCLCLNFYNQLGEYSHAALIPKSWKFGLFCKHWYRNRNTFTTSLVKPLVKHNNIHRVCPLQSFTLTNAFGCVTFGIELEEVFKVLLHFINDGSTNTVHLSKIFHCHIFI